MLGAIFLGVFGCSSRVKEYDLIVLFLPKKLLRMPWDASAFDRWKACGKLSPKDASSFNLQVL